jgi:hypothetical protein
MSEELERNEAQAFEAYTHQDNNTVYKEKKKSSKSLAK